MSQEPLILSSFNPGKSTEETPQRDLPGTDPLDRGPNNTCRLESRLFARRRGKTPVNRRQSVRSSNPRSLSGRARPARTPSVAPRGKHSRARPPRHRLRPDHHRQHLHHAGPSWHRANQRLQKDDCHQPRTARHRPAIAQKPPPSARHHTRHHTRHRAAITPSARRAITPYPYTRARLLLSANPPRAGALR